MCTRGWLLCLVSRFVRFGQRIRWARCGRLSRCKNRKLVFLWYVFYLRIVGFVRGCQEHTQLIVWTGVCFVRPYNFCLCGLRFLCDGFVYVRPLLWRRECCVVVDGACVRVGVWHGDGCRAWCVSPSPGVLIQCFCSWSSF